MKGLLCIVSGLLAMSGAAQDQFPDFDLLQKPDYSGLLSSTLMQTWTPPFSGDERSYLASAAAVGSRNVLALVGTVEPREGGWQVAVGEEGRENLRIAEKHMKSLIAIVASFEKELAGMGHDVEVLKVNLKRARTMIPKFIAADSARMFPDIPETHHWYERLSLVARWVPNVRFDRPRFGPYAASRLVFALVTQDACAKNAKLLEDMKAKGLPKEASEPELGILPMLTGLRELIQKFGPELEILGHSLAKLTQNLDSQRAQIAALLRNSGGESGYADLPPNHWAAEATSALPPCGLSRSLSSRDAFWAFLKSWGPPLPGNALG